jgi:hypothetical protein
MCLVYVMYVLLYVRVYLRYLVFIGRSLLVDLALILLRVGPPCPVMSPRGLMLGVRALSVFWFRSKKLVQFI